MAMMTLIEDEQQLAIAVAIETQRMVHHVLARRRSPAGWIIDYSKSIQLLSPLETCSCWILTGAANEEEVESSSLYVHSHSHTPHVCSVAGMSHMSADLQLVRLTTNDMRARGDGDRAQRLWMQVYCAGAVHIRPSLVF